MNKTSRYELSYVPLGSTGNEIIVKVFASSFFIEDGMIFFRDDEREIIAVYRMETINSVVKIKE